MPPPSRHPSLVTTHRLCYTPRMPRKKTAPKKKAKAAKKKPAPKKKSAPRKKKRPTRAKQQRTRSLPAATRRGLGAASAGQSGALQGLSRKENVDSESVEELLEEGQSFEAEVLSGVENAKDPDQGEVTTSEVPEDDVPGEYTDRDK
ncbi:MAG TPA: hypothetical protein VKG84_00310 [Candidatus Acidoferrales bacterium]|nr:hypothetical protein [Candidatus Acidoferrales bacterium]